MKNPIFAPSRIMVDGAAGRGRRALRSLSPAVGAIALLAAAAPALAVDGVFELSQTCAVVTGCIDNAGGTGDTPGFPITIEVPGSYRLTSNLIVSDASKDGLFIATAPVTLDLNGFKVQGPVTCSGFGSTVSCSAGTGRGIRAEGRPQITVRNGIVVAFGSDGVLVAGRSRIEGVVVERNGGTGIVTGADSVVTGSKSYRNAGDGIRVGASSTVDSSTSASNRLEGIVAGVGGVVKRSTARDNGNNGVVVDDGGVANGVVASLNEQSGIAGGDGSTLTGNNAYQNDGDGIVALIGATIDGNSSARNSGRGIAAGDGCIVRGNSTTLNGNAGIETGIATLVHGNTAVANDVGMRLGQNSAYRENLVSNNPSGGITSGGASTPFNLGSNECDGSLCP